MKNETPTFVALKIGANEKVLNQFKYFKTIFKNDGIKWVNEDNFHLTLRFIGNTTREQLYLLVDNFEGIARQYNSFQFDICGAGYFQGKGKPCALFLRTSDSKALNNLAEEIEKSVVKAGFYKELKPFRPHLTLGRIKHFESRPRFYSVIEEFEEISCQNVKVSEFILYQSILQPEGLIYKPIQIFKLR